MTRQQNLVTAIAFAALAVCALLMLLFGCGKQVGKISTGAVVTPAELLSMLPGSCGSPSYAVVQSSALPEFEADLQSRLSEIGVVGWQKRSDCKEFARGYIFFAQSRFASAAFYSFAPPPTLALAEVWYHRSDGKGHAVVAAITENGLQFIEPQTGAVVTLSSAERASVYFCRW